MAERNRFTRFAPPPTSLAFFAWALVDCCIKLAHHETLGVPQIASYESAHPAVHVESTGFYMMNVRTFMPALALAPGIAYWIVPAIAKRRLNDVLGFMHLLSMLGAWLVIVGIHDAPSTPSLAIAALVLVGSQCIPIINVLHTFATPNAPRSARA